jgi:hypothetical protein
LLVLNSLALLVQILTPACQIFPTLEVQKRLTTSLMICKDSAKGEERVVVFESNCSQKSEGSNPINEDHQNVFFPVQGVSVTVDLCKHAKTVALEHNSAQASSQGGQDASKRSLSTRTKARVATEGATDASAAGVRAADDFNGAFTAAVLLFLRLFTASLLSCTGCNRGGNRGRNTSAAVQSGRGYSGPHGQFSVNV